MSILNNSNAISSGGYTISNSLRFQSASSQYLSRTPASASNRTTWTWSAWVKRGTLGAYQRFFSVYPAPVQNQTVIRFDVADTISIFSIDANIFQLSLTTTQVFRDPSAWYHIVVSVDTAQATAANRIKLYVNGLQVTVFSTATYPAQNYQAWVNYTYQHNISSMSGGVSGERFDGYLTEVNFIDGQALTPSSFGATDPTSGQWIAAKYTGTYGTNGFYLPFSNGTSTTTLGADSSGNGNNWTLTNFTRSAGVSDCWMYDVPSGNGYSATQPSSNYAVLNPLNVTLGGSTVSTANLKVVLGATGQWRITPSTMAMPTSGKYYFEVTAGTNAGSAHGIVGIISTTDNFNVSGGVYLGQTAGGYGYLSDGQKLNNNTGAAYGASWTANDVIGVAYDADTGALVFYKNGTSQGTAYTVTSGASYYAAVAGDGQLPTFNFNGGQRSFAYTPPSGFKALCTANLPASTIVKGNQYMDATLFTGNVSGGTVTNAGGFQPDFVWRKTRDVSQNNGLYDSVRGGTKELVSNSTSAETTNAGLITSFNSNGFTYGNALASANSYVAWQWQAGQGTTSSNTNGTITSTVSVNATAGFSIVTYTGTGANATVGHGLGVAPKMMIVKDRTQANSWGVYHDAIGNTKILFLESTSAAQVTSTAWNNTSPTSTVFTIGTTGTTNQNTKGFVAYCFAEIAGFSKFGSYTGNSNADGSFVYTGFRPRYVMIKNAGLANNWCIYDTARNTYNVTNLFLTAQASTAEQTGLEIDILSNGFKARTTNDNVNSSSYSYIYMAFAENPFAQANAR